VVQFLGGRSTALEKIVRDYKLIGEKEALDFILSVVSEADGKAINNGKGSFVTSEKLTNPPSPT